MPCCLGWYDMMLLASRMPNECRSARYAVHDAHASSLRDSPSSKKNLFYWAIKRSSPVAFVTPLDRAARVMTHKWSWSWWSIMRFEWAGPGCVCVLEYWYLRRCGASGGLPHKTLSSRRPSPDCRLAHSFWFVWYLHVCPGASVDGTHSGHSRVLL